ncbi:MAG: outer membrane beta-barrel protein [Flavobacteriales bacterium]|jgi:hypothetical protein
MRLLFTCLFIFTQIWVMNAQGTVRGKVFDETGMGLPGAIIRAKEDPALGAGTDFDGNYSIDIKVASPVTLTVSFTGYETQELVVNPKGGEVVIANFDMKVKGVDIGTEVVIEGKAKKSNDYFMERMKQNSATSIDYISSETARKAGDSRVSDAVRRVPGVTTVGSFVSVRGLADRYIKTTVNGSRIPTLDPFTNNFRLDLFPTGLIDNLVITKTMNPDLPGDWAGAYLSINTKDYPDQLMVEVSTSLGFTPQTTFRDIVSSKKSRTDWLGFDNDLRDIPEGVGRDQTTFPFVVNPGLYQQFAALGLEGYLSSYGITSQSPIPTGGAFHQLALVELGYLGAAQFNNPTFVNAAINAYNQDNPYVDFFRYYNQDLEDIAFQFDNSNWFTQRFTAPLNLGQTVTIGNQKKVFNRDLGFIVGFRYASTTDYDPNATIQRTLEPEDFTPSDGRPEPSREYWIDMESSVENRGWSALANLSYKLNNNHTVSLLFMPNVNGENQARRYEGFDDDIVQSSEILIGDDQIYEERRQLIYQYSSTHYFPASRIRVEADASYTSGRRNILDFKALDYLYDFSIEQFVFRPTTAPTRIFRYMDETLLDSRISAEIPFGKEAKPKFKLKLGGAFQSNTRETQQVIYNVRGIGGLIVDDPTELFTPDRFRINDFGFTLNYESISNFLDNDISFSEVVAGYVMGDYSPAKRLRIVGGARVETTDMLTDIRRYYDLGLPANDPGRQATAGQLANPGEIQQVDVLPSLNLIFKLKETDVRLSNLRFNVSRSLARPGFRELSTVALLDYEFRAAVLGNPNLKMVSITNFDLRYENYFSNSRSFSVSLFYKDFDNHIELYRTTTGFFSWQNAPQSHIYGLEIEGRQKIRENLDLRGNITLMESQTTIFEPVEDTRSMFGQAPYVINVMAIYTWQKRKVDCTVSYNRQGPKLAVVNSATALIPDVYEVPRNVVDFRVAKRFGDHFSASLGATDLLNSPIRRSYDFVNGGYLVDFDRQTFGTTWNFTFTYKL